MEVQEIKTNQDEGISYGQRSKAVARQRTNYIQRITATLQLLYSSNINCWLCLFCTTSSTALQSTQPVTEKSTRNISCGVKATGA